MTNTRTKLITAGLLAAAAIALPACSVSVTPGTPVASSPDLAAHRAEQAAVTAANTTEVGDAPKTPREKLDALVTNVVTDATNYWARKGVALDIEVFASNETGARMCLRPSSTSSAWACSGRGEIVYDADKMLPLITAPTGGVAVVVIIGHEVGHVAQHTINPAFDTGSPLGEQGASCSSGAYISTLVEGTSGLPQITVDIAKAAIAEAYPVEGLPGMDAEGTRIARKQLEGGLESGKPCIVQHGSKP